MRNADRVGGIIGLAVMILIGVSWLASGFSSFHLGWKLALGGPLLLGATDYLLLAATGTGLRERVARWLKARRER